MPASYAHYRFGKRLLPSLPADIRQTIQRFRRMYDMGLQGPDFFFYYNVLMKTATGDLGKTFHRQTGQEFFTVAGKAATSDAAKAYLYGLLGHYCLDSTCHPFVNQLDKIGEARHVPLESELERFLLALDKEPSPEAYDVSKHIRITRGECMTVAEFFPGVSGGQVFWSIRSMAIAKKFLANPKRQKSPLRDKIPGLYDQMIPAEENPDWVPYIRELNDLYEQALERYPQLLSQLTAHLETGEALDESFASCFG